jgi:hypothetical protein
MTYWKDAHGPECCQNAPYIGARYRIKRWELLSGKDLGWWSVTVTEVGEFNPNKFGFCRRVSYTGDDGKTGICAVPSFFESFEAIDNIVSLNGAESAKLLEMK